MCAMALLSSNSFSSDVHVSGPYSLSDPSSAVMPEAFRKGDDTVVPFKPDNPKISGSLHSQVVGPCY